VSLNVIIFSEISDFWTWVVCGIIVVSGLYLMHRENLVQKAKCRSANDSQKEPE
jgi:hypothetical protein